MSTWRSVSLSFLACLILSRSAVANEHASICELYAYPMRHADKRVVVPAEIRDNGLDVSVLVDHACPDAQVDLRWTTDPAKLSNLEGLRSALFRQGDMGTMGKQIRGDFIGIFSATKVGRGLRIYLTIEAVKNLDVKLR